MITIRHSDGFDYLRPDHAVVDHYISKSATAITFVARSGVQVTVSGTNMVANGAVNARATVSSITVRSPDGSELAHIGGVYDRVDVVLGLFEQGNGFPRLFSGFNTMVGTGADDIIEGYVGDDKIDGGDGDDLLGGGEGDDFLTAGSGNDALHGGVGVDTVALSGVRGDWVFELSKSEAVATSISTGQVKTLSTIELVSFSDGRISLADLPGVTRAATEDGAVMVGTLGRDRLDGSDGDDHLAGAGGPDVLTGRGGNDVYDVSRADQVVEAVAGGYDHINLLTSSLADGPMTFALPENVESLAVTHRSTPAVIIDGNALANTIHSAEGDDIVRGHAGSDHLQGGAGNDTLSGDDGSDHLVGAGDDDHLLGADGADKLEGGGGDDVLLGGAGNDVLFGDIVGAEGASVPSEAVATRAHLEGKEAPPNVLFVSIDDLAPVFAAFPDAPFIAKTPHLDSFFGTSTVFTNAHASTPFCNPSRASVLLGVDGETSGISSNSDSLIQARETYQSLPSYLQETGYLTALSGKMFHDGADYGDPAAWTEYTLQPTRSDWRPASFDTSRSTIPGVFAPDVTDEAFNDARSVSALSSFLGRDHADPFFFGLGILHPHGPLHVPKEYYDLYPIESIDVPALDASDLADLGKFGLATANDVNPGVIVRDELQTISPAADPLQIKLGIQAYLAAVSYADAVFGKAMAALQASAYADNTAIVLWSDHGFHLGEKFHFSKFTLWEQGTRAPLAFHLPGQEQGQSVSSSVSLMDIYKTVTDIVGLETPGHVQGNSLLPLIENPLLSWDHPSVTSFSGSYSVRSNEYRLIHYADGSEELYDHRVDPSELRNLAGDPGLAHVLAHLRRFIPGGNDRMSGGMGDDQVHGGAGDDLLFGDEGKDDLRGGLGNDRLDGGIAADTMSGGAGDDTYLVDEAGDAVVEASDAGTDEVRTSLASYVLASGVENLTGLSAQGQSLTGNNLNNNIVGGAGNDRLNGGQGSDTVIFAAATAAVAVYLTAQAQPDGDILIDIENVTGSDFDDYLSGARGTNRLSGGSGNDRLLGLSGYDHLIGGAGDDQLDGGSENDRMEGGTGSDVYIVSEAGDAVFEALAEGFDVVLAYVDHVLARNVEELRLIKDARNGTGNGLDNLILGSTGDDTLSGVDGADRLNGGNGLDRVHGGAGNDLVYGAAGDDALMGGRDNDRLFGQSGYDRLHGGTGSDTLFGGDNPDSLFGDDGADTLLGDGGRDQLTGGAGADSFVFDQGHVGAVRGQADVIKDFKASEGDKVDLRPVDANAATTRDDAFRFVGTASFTGIARELRYEVLQGSVFLQGDTNGDGLADFYIKLEGVSTLSAVDVLG
jgi:Ca2+-binding RTX toxin-like protein